MKRGEALNVGLASPAVQWECAAGSPLAKCFTSAQRTTASSTTRQEGGGLEQRAKSRTVKHSASSRGLRVKLFGKDLKRKIHLVLKSQLEVVFFPSSQNPFKYVHVKKGTPDHKKKTKHIAQTGLSSVFCGRRWYCDVAGLP